MAQMPNWAEVIPWGGLWDHRPHQLDGQTDAQYQEEPTKTRNSAHALAKPSIKHENRFYLDLEPPEFHQLSEESQWPDAIRIMTTILQNLRKELPHASFGYWSTFPDGRFWPPAHKVYYDKICPKCEKATEIVEEIAKGDIWNESFLSLAQEMDVVFPRLYTDYKERCVDNTSIGFPPTDNNEDQCSSGPLNKLSNDQSKKDPNAWYASREGWKAYAEESIRVARQARKPVYAFLWPQYNEGSRCRVLEGEVNKYRAVKKNPNPIDLSSATRLRELPNEFQILVKQGYFKESTDSELKKVTDESSFQHFVKDFCRDPGRIGRMAIPGEYWRKQLETAYRFADGIAIWDAVMQFEKHPDAKKTWASLVQCDAQPLKAGVPLTDERKRARSHWWHQTLEFLYEKDISTLPAHEACGLSIRTDNAPPVAPAGLQLK